MNGEIGIVVPTRNSGDTLEATLRSLSCQDDVRPKIIAVDSDSTDTTRELLDCWAIETLNVPAGNMYKAINAGISALDTRWVTWVNSDDLLYRDALSRLTQAGNDRNASVVYGQCDYCDWNGRFLFGFTAAETGDLLPLCSSGILGFAQHAAIFRRDLWHQLGGLSEEFRFASDLDYYLRALLSGAPFERVGGPPVAQFRIHDAQLSTVRFVEMEAEKRLIAARAKSSRASRIAARWRWRLQNAHAYVLRSLRRRALK